MELFFLKLANILSGFSAKKRMNNFTLRAETFPKPFEMRIRAGLAHKSTSAKVVSTSTSFSSSNSNSDFNLDPHLSSFWRRGRRKSLFYDVGIFKAGNVSFKFKQNAKKMLMKTFLPKLTLFEPAYPKAAQLGIHFFLSQQN